MTDTLPPLGALSAFALVAETGSLTAAARALNVTQPAISRRLRELEAALGVALVRRGANSLRLTEAGTRYAEALSEAFGLMRRATAELSVAPGPFRVRAYTTWARHWLIPRLARFRAAHPGREIEVVASTAPVDFGREAVDAAIRSGPSGTPPAPGAMRLQALHVAPFAARAQAGGSLLGSRVRPDDWARWCAATGHPPPATPPLLFESTTLAIQAAIEGLGAVICPPEFVEGDLRARRLRPLPGGAVAMEEHYWLLLPPGPVAPMARAFAAWLLAEAGA